MPPGVTAAKFIKGWLSHKLSIEFIVASATSKTVIVTVVLDEQPLLVPVTV